jgi:hypothetical protein
MKNIFGKKITNAIFDQQTTLSKLASKKNNDRMLSRNLSKVSINFKQSKLA